MIYKINNINFIYPTKNDYEVQKLNYKVCNKLNKNNELFNTPEILTNWRDWANYSDAIASASEDQIRCWESFEYFRIFINNHQTFPHMRLWEKELLTGENSRYLHGISGKDTLILAPRESAKSTYLAQWVSWCFGMHLSPWIGVALKVLGVSYNIDTALPRSRQIQAIIQSENYKKIFPWIRPSLSKFGEKEWMLDLAWAGLPTIEEQYSYVCAGLTGAINSRRCHLVLLDDLIKSPESIRNPSVRDAMISNWENVIQYTRYDGSRAVCLGTRMASNDIYCTTFTPDNNWNVLQQSALITNDDGTESSFWEPSSPKSAGIPLTRLVFEREHTPISFYFQRQNKIIKIESQSISLNLIVRSIIPNKVQTLVLGVDLSAGLSSANDYSAFILGAKCFDNSFYIIDAWENRIMGNLEKLRNILDIYDTWKHLLPQNKVLCNKTDKWVDSPSVNFHLWFDSSAYGLSFKGDFDDFIRANKIYNWIITQVPASGKGDKLTRLRKHSAIFENKLIYFNKFTRTMPDGRKPMSRLIEQITDFGNTQHDDLADAFELCMSGLRNHQDISYGNYL